MDFGEKLKALRTERGLTQEQLAAKLYVSRTAVSKWETGGGSPNLDSLQVVARLFDVSVDDLLSTDDLIVLARDERRSTARSSGMLSFGLLDVLAVVFAFIPLYGVDDGSLVRMANLADYGASVDFGASFAAMAAAVVSLMFMGAVEIVLAAVGSRRAARIVALVGFAVQALAVVLFASTMQPYATTLVRAAWRRSSSATVFCVNPGRLRRSRTVSPVRRIVACRRRRASFH
ncbi:MAG: helix-turn-helix transcriptional regulator [Eggerthella lenta]